MSNNQFDETVQPLHWNGLHVEIDHLDNGIPFLVIGDKVHEITMGGADAATLRDWLSKAVTCRLGCNRD